MLDDIKVLGHSCLKFKRHLVIYVDPYQINKNYGDADLIFITHDHYDHFSLDDLTKVCKATTILIAPQDCITKLLASGYPKSNLIVSHPNQKYTIHNLNFNTVPAYNLNKTFHPKASNWVGYVIELDNTRYYVAGDTDITPESQKVKCDVAFVPVGGTYTMDFRQAAALVNKIKPQIAVPIHYGTIVGTKEDAENFVALLEPNIRGVILLDK